MRRADRTDADEGPGPSLTEKFSIIVLTSAFAALMLVAVVLGSLGIAILLDWIVYGGWQ